MSFEGFSRNFLCCEEDVFMRREVLLSYCISWFDKRVSVPMTQGWIDIVVCSVDLDWRTTTDDLLISFYCEPSESDCLSLSWAGLNWNVELVGSGFSGSKDCFLSFFYFIYAYILVCNILQTIWLQRFKGLIIYVLLWLDLLDSTEKEWHIFFFFHHRLWDNWVLWGAWGILW